LTGIQENLTILTENLTVTKRAEKFPTF